MKNKICLSEAEVFIFPGSSAFAEENKEEAEEDKGVTEEDNSNRISREGGNPLVRLGSMDPLDKPEEDEVVAEEDEVGCEGRDSPPTRLSREGGNPKSFIKELLFLFFIIITMYLPVSASELKKLTVVLDWTINPNHAPIFVAQQEGFFKQHGLQVELISPADASSGEKMVAAGKADIAITYQPKLVQLVTQGLPVIRFASLINHPLNCFVTLDDGNIKSIQDLKGKRIGVAAQNTDYSIFLSTMLHRANLNIKDITPIYVKFNLMSALLTNKIDGFSGGMRNVEPLVIKSMRKNIKVFYPEDYGFPEYDELILIANKNKINDPYLMEFTDALRQGVLHLKKYPDKSWQDFSKQYPALNNSLNKKIWFTTLKYFADNPAKLEYKKYENLTKFLLHKDFIKSMPKIEEYAYELK